MTTNPYQEIIATIETLNKTALPFSRKRYEKEIVPLEREAGQKAIFFLPGLTEEERKDVCLRMEAMYRRLDRHCTLAAAYHGKRAFFAITSGVLLTVVAAISILL